MASLAAEEAVGAHKNVLMEIAWAAGFIEGEGCLTFSKNSPVITAVQKTREPLNRLHRLFGGTMSIYTDKRDRSYFRWHACGSSAAGAMMTMYPLLSCRRQAKAEEALSRFKSANARNSFMSERGICPKHGAGTVKYRGIYRKKIGRAYCTVCHKEWSAKSAEKRRIKYRESKEKGNR